MDLDRDPHFVTFALQRRPVASADRLSAAALRRVAGHT
jgi:hypothetical protein